MENEIEKLKQAYLKTETPFELELSGFEDVLARINRKKRNNFYIYRYVGFSAIFLVLLSGFVGITFASKPNSTLYPLKVAAQQAIADVAHSTPKHVEESINNFMEPKKITPTSAPLLLQSDPTPTSTPTPTLTSDWRRNESKKETDNTEQQSSRQNTETEVKGISTTKAPESKQNSHQEVQSHNNSDTHDANSESSNSNSHSNNNSSKNEKD